VFTARYTLNPYIKQTRFVFKGLMFRNYIVFYICQNMSAKLALFATDMV
jgi:hypothetical protein